MAASGNVVPAGKEIIFQKVVRFDAPPQAVYDVLADINTHFVWGGTKGKKNFQLTGIQAASAPAQKGSEFSSTGIAPAGTFRDRSVVTEASPPAAFEFLTDSHVSFKKGKEGVWAVINRYEITPDGAGSRVA